MSDDGQVADIEYKLAEVERSIAMLTEITEAPKRLLMHARSAGDDSGAATAK